MNFSDVVGITSARTISYSVTPDLSTGRRLSDATLHSICQPHFSTQLRGALTLNRDGGDDNSRG
jgi:hypothetical protein